MSILKSKHSGWTWEGRRTPFVGGGGGGGTTTSTGTTYQTNLPEYAQPYVETMLGATQRQLFNTQQTPEGVTEITGFQPYTPYSTDPTKYVAGFSPLQTQAQQATANLQTPGAYGQAMGITGLSGLQQLGAGQQYAQQVTNPAAVGAYMSPYQQSVTDIAKMNAVREAQIAGQQANLGASRQGTYGGARQALMSAEREKNLLSNLSNIQAQGSQAAYDKAMQSMQYGAGLNLQGLQGAGQMAGQMGTLAGQQFGTEKDIIGLQSQAGAQQQAQQQQIINQAIQDYANAQQYPLMQLGFMSNMLRGLPMQATNTQQYVATPNPLTQGLGIIGTGANIYNAFQGNATRVAQGGEIKSYAKGGIASYSAGDRVKSDLANIRSADELEEIARNTTSDTIRREALRLAKMRELGLAGGGIVAFADGKTVYGQSNKTREDYELKDSEELKARREADIAAALALKAERDAVDAKPSTSSIMFDQMKNRPTSGGIPMLERPENFKVDAAAADVPATRPQKGYEALFGIKSSGSSGSGRTAADVRSSKGVPAVVKQDVKDSVLKTVAEDAVDTTKSEAPPTTAAAPAAASVEKKDTGIKAAARKDDVAPGVVPSTEGISKGRAGIQGLSPTAQALYERSLPEERSIADIVKEVRDAREGTIGANKGAQEDRANVMAQKANAQEEARRQAHLRQAKFWSDFGATPGPVLVAAMTAFKKNAESLIEGEKEARKVQSDLDKIIRDLNKAERLEAEGDFDAAFKIKMEARKEAKDINKTLLQYQMNKEAAQVKATGSDRIFAAKSFNEAQRARDRAQVELNRIRQSKGYLEAKRKSALPGDTDQLKKMREEGTAEMERLEREQLDIIADNQAVLDEAGKQLGRTTGKSKESKADKKVINLDKV